MLVVRKKEDEAGAKAEEAGPLPDRQGLNFSASLYLVSWYIVDRPDFISPVHKTSLWRSSMRAGITRIPLHVSRSRGCVPVDSTARSGLFKAYISKLRFFVDGEFVVRMEFVQTKGIENFHVVYGILGTRLWLWFGLVGGVDGFFESVDMRLTYWEFDISRFCFLYLYSFLN